jgi:Anti-sigma-K factor rskA/Putative zinc-finger
MSQVTEIHALAGAYALDAVNDVERVEFSRHLSGCEACGLEVAELRATAARLADSTWAAAPPRLRDSVLLQVSHTRQARPGRSDRGSGPAEEPARSRRWRRWATAGIAAAVLAAGAAAGTFVVQERRVAAERQQALRTVDQLNRIQSVMAAEDAKARQIRLKGGGQLAVVYSPGQRSAVVMCAGLASPDRTRAYQLWLMRDDEATSAGVLPAGANAGTMLITNIGPADAIAISLQNAGGDSAPGERAGTVTLA